MDKSKIAKISVVALILVLFAGVFYLQIKLLVFDKELQGKQLTCQLNDKVLIFANLFVSKVIKAEKEVSFEDRLKLENAVRDVQNKDLFDQWQKFVGANDETVAKEEMKNLLEMTIKKISN